ncbi:hypothetical protein [Natronorubrum aibiense]|uniref:Uncharacterized protein n=1 Tax=Natronorubrum aibiense TaxID=348826 RepID=A0A5P9P9D9_9EURY|nr:hypothetical protein [Natronorubrum aibiense]QFU84759.1 hypothetical protein GCU68_19790 [Natronorubrum aibiense]
MDRRQLIAAIGSVYGTATIAGCIDGDETSDQDIEDGSDTENSTSNSDESSSSNSEEQANSEGKEEEEEEESCRTEVKSQSESLVDRSRELDGNSDWTEEYRCETGDTVHFDISTSVGQDVAVEIDSPEGHTVYSETGLSLTTTHRFNSSGEGKVRIENLGERTEPETKNEWDDRVEVDAGSQLDPWFEIEEGDHIDYYIRMVDDARPNLRIEDSSGTVQKEHSVSKVIDGEFTAPEDDRYYFFMENTAMVTSGTWDFTFQYVEEVPISTTVELAIEREYEEEVEICD